MTEWILIAITFVYVIATILICIFNYETNKTNKKIYLETKIPFIVANPIINPLGKLSIEFKNISNACAKELILDFSKVILQDFQKNLNKFYMKFPDNKYILAPTQSAYFVLEDTFLDNNSLGTLLKMGVIHVNIQYRDLEGNRYSSSQIVDTSNIDIKKLKYR